MSFVIKWTGWILDESSDLRYLVGGIVNSELVAFGKARRFPTREAAVKVAKARYRRGPACRGLDWRDLCVIQEVT